MPSDRLREIAFNVRAQLSADTAEMTEQTLAGVCIAVARAVAEDAVESLSAYFLSE